MNNNFIKQMQGKSAAAAAKAGLYGYHMGQMLLGITLFLPIWLEYLVAVDTSEKVLRGWDGVLTATEQAWIAPTAIVFCIVTLTWFHWSLAPAIGKARKNAMGLVLLGVVIVTLSQPMIGLFSDMRTGNSLSANASDSISLQNWLLTAGYMTRAIVILMAAITATIGIMVMRKAIKGLYSVRQNRQKSETLARSVRSVDDGYREAETIKRDGTAYNRDCARQYTRAVVDGKLDMARTVGRYLKKSGDPFVNPNVWVDEVIEQFDQPSVPSDPKIAELVRDRLKQHAIDMSQLPENADELPPEARSELVKYADWLREHANFNTIYNATIYQEKGHSYV